MLCAVRFFYCEICYVPSGFTVRSAVCRQALPSDLLCAVRFYCQICGVSATCQVQLDTHMTGSRHKLQAKRLGLPVPAESEWDDPRALTAPADTILSTAVLCHPHGT